MRETPKRDKLRTYADACVKSLATDFGGWHKLLDSAQPLPAKFVEKLSAGGYKWEREIIDFVRLNERLSEAESHAVEIAINLSLHLKHFYGEALDGLVENGLFWDSMFHPTWWEESEKVMEEHNISKDVVESLVMEILPTVPVKRRNGPHDPPRSSRVPLNKSPDSGDTSDELFLPEPDENL